MADVYNYNPNTGAKLNPGETVWDIANQRLITQGQPVGSGTTYTAAQNAAAQTQPAGSAQTSMQTAAPSGVDVAKWSGNNPAFTDEQRNRTLEQAKLKAAQTAGVTSYGPNDFTLDASGNLVYQKPVTASQNTTLSNSGTASEQTTQQTSDIQTQLEDLQAQAAALKSYGLTDTVQLQKDASGNYTPTPAAVTQQLKDAGLSDATINSMTDAQKQAFTSVASVIKSSYASANPVPSTFTADDLSKLMTEAQNDPTISKYYNDNLKVGQTEFMNAFSQLQASSTTTAAEQQRQYDNAKKNMDEAKAAAGQAYSGFRAQAQEDLSKQESAIVESSRQGIQSNLQTITSAFEKQYGTDAIPQMGSIQGVMVSPVGGVTGTEAANKTADITGRYNELVNKAALTKGITV